MNEKLNMKLTSDLDDLIVRYEGYRENLNEQGIWLFLATLGCWSVEGLYTTLALIITFIIFTLNAFPRKEGAYKVFFWELRKLKKQIKESKLSKNDKQFWLLTIQMTKDYFSFIYDLKTSPFFYLAYIFLLATMFKEFKI